VGYQKISHAFAEPLPSQRNRVFRLKWGDAQPELDDLLLPQRIDIREALFDGIDGTISCVSTSAGIPLNTFIGRPLAIQLVTDRGALHSICGLVTDAYEGESDRSLAVYQLVIHDALTVLERRVNTRVFRKMSVLDIVGTLVSEWRRKSATLAGAFHIDLSKLDPDRYPVREQTNQFDESDAHFIRRLCRREGIGWFIRAGSATSADANGDGSRTAHSLVLFDNAVKLTQCAGGKVVYRPGATAGKRDAITLLSTQCQLVPGSMQRRSWDYKAGRVDHIHGAIRIDQGGSGNDLARLLSDSRLDSPHFADSWDHYDEIGLARIQSHEAGAARTTGVSGVRDLAVGHSVELTGTAELERLPDEVRRVTITHLHHRGENNLPKNLSERAQALFAASRWRFDTPPVSVDTPARPTVSGESAPSRYENTFTAVAHKLPLTPSYDACRDLPRVYPITATVVTPNGEEVFCDEHGRIHVQLTGLDPVDHAHAQGAGTSGTNSDSAAVRVLTGWAGDSFGENMLPRKGMEVLLDFLNGDPDKMFVAGVFHNGLNMPATFSHAGSLPGNRYLSGTKTREVNGERYNQLRFDDTPSQISVQLASEHAASEVNLGYLTHPRTNGHGTDRGQGAELRTDAAAAVRAAKGILLTTFARIKAVGHQLDREELMQLLDEGEALFKALGQYAGQHGGTAADSAAQTQLVSAVKHWDASVGSASSNALADDGNAIMAFGASAGSVNVTPKTHFVYAGQNIDQIAQQHLQLMSGQQFNATAGRGMHLFARGSGVQAIAAQGPMVLQAQADALTATAQKGVKISTNENEVFVSAPTIRLVAEDGSYIKIGGGVTLGTNGDAKILANSHVWDGPATQPAQKTAFAGASTDQCFTLHYPGDAAQTPPHAANQPYRITFDDGRVIEGETDANGLAELIKDDAMRILKIDLLKAGL